MNQKKQHEGVVRPFLLLAKGLRDANEVSFALLNCGDELSDYIKGNSNGFVIASNDKKTLIEELKKQKPQFIMADDNFAGLKLLKDIRQKIEAKTISYVQILYGTHAIADCFDLSLLRSKDKILFSSARFVPFLFFRRRYSNFLGDCDLVVANSKVTATFLHALYNMEVHGVVYPPVDTEVFKPNNHSKKRKEITLYLGSHLGDVNAKFAMKIVKIGLKNENVINLFGDSKSASVLLNKYKDSVTYHSNIEDRDLAEVYSRSSITICPQKWEQFGLVPVESMSCGTPVLAFNCMGFQETIMDERTGWLANSGESFLQTLDYVLEKRTRFSERDLRSYAVQNFSIGASVKRFESLLGDNSAKLSRV